MVKFQENGGCLAEEQEINENGCYCLFTCFLVHYFSFLPLFLFKHGRASTNFYSCYDVGRNLLQPEFLLGENLGTCLKLPFLNIFQQVMEKVSVKELNSTRDKNGCFYKGIETVSVSALSFL